jgi:hypothetical protein
MTRPRSSVRRSRFGAITDDPVEIMSLASRELGAARGLMAQRQAAEKAHLALSSAVEVATLKQIKSYGEELEALKLISKRAKDPLLPKDYAALRTKLHSDCFHGGRCGTTVELAGVFGEAKAMMGRILRTKSTKRKRH